MVHKLEHIDITETRAGNLFRRIEQILIPIDANMSVAVLSSGGVIYHSEKKKTTTFIRANVLQHSERDMLSL